MKRFRLRVLFQNMPNYIMMIIGALLVTIPLSDYLLGQLFVIFMRDYPGWLPYRSFVSVYVKTALIGIGSFAVIALALTRKIKKVPLADALKNVDE